MSTDLERQLREALLEDAQRARLLNPDAPPAPEARALPTSDDRRPSVRMFVAAAAVVAVLAFAAAVTLLDDDQNLDTVPPATQTSLPGTEITVPRVGTTPLPPRPAVRVLEGRTIVSGSGCPFGITGESVDLQPGRAGERFDLVGGQTAAYLVLGAQTAEVHVPGFGLREQAGWQIEPIQLEGRSAMVWLDGPESASHGGANLPFVQIRYFPAGDEPCSSFTVTVDGGTQEANRQTAVDLAERILLPADLGDLDLPGTEGGPVAGLELPGTSWPVTAPNHPADGAQMAFTGTTVSWTDGCATVTAAYELDRDDGILVLTDRTSTDPGCTPPTHSEFPLGWPMIASVMSRDRIDVQLIDGRLYLGNYPGEDYLVLGTP